MKKLITALLILAITSTAQAETSAEAKSDMIGLGMRAELSSYIAGLITGGAVLRNNVYQKARNAAGSANIDVLKVDATDDTVLNADSGDVIKLAAAGTTVFTVDSTGTFIGAGTSSIGWTLVSAANQACNTTCVTPCVVGQETTSKAFLACTDATADICLCAGAS